LGAQDLGFLSLASLFIFLNTSVKIAQADNYTSKAVAKKHTANGNQILCFKEIINSYHNSIKEKQNNNKRNQQREKDRSKKEFKLKIA